jgi:ERCC4-related helicase
MGYGKNDIKQGGKIFFLAPTRPLVTQQLKTFNNIPTVNNSHVTELTGDINPNERSKVYENAAIFFMTP